MSASKKIKQIMIDKPIKVGELAEKLGMNPQVLSNKLYRDTMTYANVRDILDALDCDIVFVDRITGKEYK